MVAEVEAVATEDGDFGRMVRLGGKKSMKKELAALFHPQIICLDEAVLKYLVLNFDRIYFLPNDVRLNPGHDSLSRRFSIWDTLLLGGYGTVEDVRRSTMYASESPAWDDEMRSLMATYDWLESQGVCVPLKDAAWEDSNAWHPLREAAEADAADVRFAELCRAYENKKIIVTPSRGEIKGGGLATRPAAAKQVDSLPTVAAERVNSTLYWAERMGAVPVSNRELFNRAYGIKLQRATENRQFWDSRGLRVQTRNLTLGILHWELFSELIPFERLASRSVEDITLYKQESGELRERYRSHVEMLETEVVAEPWDTSHAKEIDRLVRGKVIPDLQSLSERRLEVWDKLFGEGVRIASQKRYLFPLVGASLIPGVSYLDLLQYTVPAMALAAMPRVAELALEQRRLRRNALFFLLNFK